jgi:endoglucanase
MDPFIAVLTALCNADGTPGWEDGVRAAIRERVAGKAQEIKADALGNLLVFCRGKRRAQRTVMVCAHMDEVGLIVKAIQDDGTLTFSNAGGVDPRVLPAKRVRIGSHTGSVPGAIMFPHSHLQSKDEKTAGPKIASLRIDIGCSNRAEAEALVTPGAPVFFDTQAELFGDGLFRAKAIDDRLGCAVMCQLIDEVPPVDAWFVFTVQEEVGLRGATVAARAVQPACALIVEGTTACDFPALPAHKRICAVGGGAVIPFMDRGSVAHAGLYGRITTLAETHNIPWQTKEYVSGGTDAGAVQSVVPGVETLGIAAPVRYIHAPASVVSLADCRHVLSLARLFLESEAEAC